MTKKRSYHFIINPISGIRKKLHIVDALNKFLDSDKINWGVSFTQREEHATILTLEAIERKIDAVIVVGGDGSVNEVAKALINTNVALGVIPAGSGNGFARHLKIPMAAKSAITNINEFNPIKIDTGSVNGLPFLATTGMGFDAQIGWKFASFGKRGFLSYMQLTINEFLKYKACSYQLTIDGKKIETEAFLINIANAGQYGNNAWIAPSASVFDGLLDISILKPFPHHMAPDIVYKLFNKEIEKSNYYQSFQAKEIHIMNPGQFHMDGEPKSSEEDLLIKVHPKNLTVIK